MLNQMILLWDHWHEVSVMSAIQESKMHPSPITCPKHTLSIQPSRWIKRERKNAISGVNGQLCINFRKAAGSPQIIVIATQIADRDEMTKTIPNGGTLCILAPLLGRPSVRASTPPTSNAPSTHTGYLGSQSTYQYE